MSWRYLCAVILLAACRGDRRSSGGGPYADIVTADIPKIEKAVGVPFKRPPKLEVRSRDQVRAFVTAQLDDSVARRDLAGQEAAYKVLGLIPDTMNVRALFLNFLTEQILGIYDAKTKVLYVRSDAPEDYVGITIMHELVHALQDQYTNVDSLLNAPNDDDHRAAIKAVIEGEATYEQMVATVGEGNVAARLPGGWDRMRELIRDSQMSPVFSASPMVIQEEALFAYINGADFVKRFKDHEPGKLPFVDMPQSTEQVMHDAAFFGPRRDAPLRITLPKIAGQIYQNTLGEFDTRLFLYEHLQDRELASRAAMGWGGDRYAVVQTPNGNAFVWASAWDTSLDAAEFVDAFGQATQRRYRASAPALGPGGSRTYAVRGRTVLVTPGEISGKNIVLIVDVPAGTSPRLVDLAHVTIGG